MARSTPKTASVRSELVSPEESEELRKSYLNMRIDRLREAIDEKILRDYGGDRKGWDSDTSKRLGMNSAMQRELELLEGDLKDPNAYLKLKNERDDKNSEWFIEKQEQKIKDSELEIAIVYDRYNRLISINQGGESEAKSAILNARQITGGTLTHNHPKHGSQLSVQDIETFVDRGIASIRAVAKEDGSLSELRYLGEMPNNSTENFYREKYGKKFEESMNKMGDVFEEISRDVFDSAMIGLRMREPETYERLIKESEKSETMESFLESPIAAQTIQKTVYKRIEEKWQNFVAGELEQYDIGYFRNGKKI